MNLDRLKSAKLRSHAVSHLIHHRYGNDKFITLLMKINLILKEGRAFESLSIITLASYQSYLQPPAKMQDISIQGKAVNEEVSVKMLHCGSNKTAAVGMELTFLFHSSIHLGMMTLENVFNHFLFPLCSIL